MASAVDARSAEVMLGAIVNDHGLEWLESWVEQRRTLEGHAPRKLPRDRVTFEARCQDCGWHWLGSGSKFLAEDARSRALAHADSNATHRVQMCDINGWHRP